MPCENAVSSITYGNAIVDLRSDTVTKPGAAMRAAMAGAEVGDDVYGEDPTVKALEAATARLLGKEAALFVSSGTQGNLAALLAHCGRGDEYLVGDRYHSFTSEAGGAAALGGIVPFPLPTDPEGGLDPLELEAAVKPSDAHYPVSRLLCLENTVSGFVQAPARMQALADAARRHGLKIHLDGARLLNAAVRLGVAPAALAAPMDSVSICLSKGLGAPVGSVLAGSAEFIARAYRARKILGGALRQAGVLAAAGLYALEHNVARLAEDHARAARLAEGLQGLPGIGVTPTPTNMVFLTLPPARHGAFVKHLADHGILAGGRAPRLRLVTHLDVDDAGIERTIQAARGFAIS